jgi:hypothetical protein
MEIGSMAKQPSAVYQLPVLKRYIIFNCLMWPLGVCIIRGLVHLAGAGTWAGYKLEVLDGHSQLAAFRAILGLPAIERQASFNKQGISLLTIFIDDLGSFAEHPAVNKAGFFPLAAVLADPPAIRGHAEINYRRLVRCIRQLGIAG